MGCMYCTCTRAVHACACARIALRTLQAHQTLSYLKRLHHQHSQSYSSSKVQPSRAKRTRLHISLNENLLLRDSPNSPSSTAAKHGDSFILDDNYHWLLGGNWSNRSWVVLASFIPSAASTSVPPNTNPWQSQTTATTVQPLTTSVTTAQGIPAPVPTAGNVGKSLNLPGHTLYLSTQASLG